MKHSHNDAEHQKLANRASEIKVLIDELYVEHHNGDQKLNRRIMNVKDSFGAFNALFEEHIDHTTSIDAEFKESQRAIKILKSIKMFLFGGIGTAVVTFILDRFFDMF